MGGAPTSSIVLGILFIGSLFAYSKTAAAPVVDNHLGGDHFDGNENYQEFIWRISLQNKTASEQREEQRRQSLDILSRDISRYTLSPLSLGVETAGGAMNKLFLVQPTYPSRRSKIVTTTRDLQTSVTIQVFQGSRRLTRNCLFLGEFNLTGIHPAPRGTPHIEVTFEIDDRGTLNVKAEDNASGVFEKMAIPFDDYSVWYEDTQEMMREAEEEKKAEEDKMIGPHVLKTYVYNHIRNHVNDRDNKQSDKLVKKVKASTDDDLYDDLYRLALSLMAESLSRRRFKNKGSKSDNQIVER